MEITLFNTIMAVFLLVALCVIIYWIASLFIHRRELRNQNIFLAEKLKATMGCLDRVLNNTPEEFPDIRRVLDFHRKDLDEFIPPKNSKSENKSRIRRQKPTRFKFVGFFNY